MVPFRMTLSDLASHSLSATAEHLV